MKSKSNHHKPSIILYFIIILALSSAFFYEFGFAIGINIGIFFYKFVNYYYLYFYVIIILIPIIYFEIHHHMPDSDLIRANPVNVIYFLSVGIIFLFSLIYNPKSLMVVILVSLLSFSGLGFIIFYIIQPRKDANQNIETLKTKKILINIFLILFFWIPTYLYIYPSSRITSNVDMNTGIILIILGLGYFLYQKHDKLTLNRKFLGFLLIFVVVLSIIPVINYRIFVRNNIEYKEIHNIENTIPNSYISAVEPFNYTNNYNWSRYMPYSNGIFLPSDRFWYQNHIDSLRHALFIPNSNFKSKFLYNLSAVSIKTPLNISYRYFGSLDIVDNYSAEQTVFNVSSSSSILYQSPYYSHSHLHIWQSFIFLNHSDFMNPTNVSQGVEINNGYIIKLEIQYMQTFPLSSEDWNQYQLAILDEYGNVMFVIVYNYFTIILI